MIDKDNLQAVLDAMVNDHKVTPEVGLAIREILNTLRDGSAAQKEAAQVIVDALTWFGSDNVIEAAEAIHAALQTQQGRKAAGLPKRTRGLTYDPDKATIGTDEFEVVLKLVLGKIDMEQARVEVAHLLSLEMDHKTIDRYIHAIRPRAESFAAFLQQAKPRE